MFSYFQQTSWLMQLDKSVKIVNAYNYNAFPHAATDASKILLVNSYPYYGWMVGREQAMMLVNNWASSNSNKVGHNYLGQSHLNLHRPITLNLYIEKICVFSNVCLN